MLLKVMADHAALRLPFFHSELPLVQCPCARSAEDSEPPAPPQGQWVWSAPSHGMWVWSAPSPWGVGVVSPTSPSVGVVSKRPKEEGRGSVFIRRDSSD